MFTAGYVVMDDDDAGLVRVKAEIVMFIWLWSR